MKYLLSLMYTRPLKSSPVLCKGLVRLRSLSDLSYVSNVKLMQELKENNDKCKQYLENGQYLVYHKGRPLLKFPKEDSSSLQILEFDFKDLLHYFEDPHQVISNAVLLELGKEFKARCAVSIPSKEESVAERMEKETGGSFYDMRVAIFLLPIKHSSIVAQGGALLYWHRHFKFCNRCGKETLRNIAGSHIQCSSCSQLYYPQLSPVAIVVVTNPTYDKCLLVRQPRLPPGVFTAIAGYVEVGETLEDAVKREIAEEVGLEISHQEYLFSQHWPLPMSSLMLGCLAVANSEKEISLDTRELAEARWFSRPEVAQAVECIERDPNLRFSLPKELSSFLVPPKGAVAHDLIKYWLTRSSL